MIKKRAVSCLNNNKRYFRNGKMVNIKLVSKIGKKVKSSYFHFFEKQMLMHKLLSITKVWTLRAERKIDSLLHGIRKKAQEIDKKNGKNGLN